ncbi:MAG TPA: type II toxin-antitoxin system VapC family toxin [Candidatus Tyrphobacter sp.]
MAGPRRYLLDTNIASYIIREKDPIIRRRLRRVPVSGVCISAITQAELLFGVARKSEAKALSAAVSAFLDHVEVLAWGSDSAKCYAELRARSERKGVSLGSLDMLIAAHAIAVGAVLVTNDAAFKNIEQARIEDWTKPR